jgi:hypothetical protein
MFVTLKFDGAAIGAVYSSLGIAAVLPTLLGIVADKWISRGFMPFAIWSRADAVARRPGHHAGGMFLVICSTRWPICQRWGD